MDNNFNNQGEYHNYSQQPPQGGYPQPQDYPTPPYCDPNSQGDPNQPNSGLAIASMVLGICGVVFGCCTYYIGFLLGIIGITLGAVALSKKAQGKGMAIAGLVLSIITILLSALSAIIGAALLSGLDSPDDLALFIR